MEYINRDLNFKTGFFPVFLDYDFKNSRPRGISSFFDFFTFGRLCSMLDEVNNDGLVFLRDNTLIEGEGCFFVDFAAIMSDSSDFVKTLQKMGVEKLYMENSKKYPVIKTLSKDFPKVVAVEINE